jgi:hypothetical protein
MQCEWQVRQNFVNGVSYSSARAERENDINTSKVWTEWVRKGPPEYARAHNSNTNHRTQVARSSASTLAHNAHLVTRSVA